MSIQRNPEGPNQLRPDDPGLPCDDIAGMPQRRQSLAFRDAMLRAGFQPTDHRVFVDEALRGKRRKRG